MGGLHVAPPNRESSVGGVLGSPRFSGRVRISGGDPEGAGTQRRKTRSKQGALFNCLISGSRVDVLQARNAV